MNGKGDGMGDVICAKAGDERRGKEIKLIQSIELEIIRLI